MTAVSAVRVLLLGEPDRAEMRTAAAFLRDNIPAENLFHPQPPAQPSTHPTSAPMGAHAQTGPAHSTAAPAYASQHPAHFAGATIGVTEALARSRDDSWFPDLVVVFQSWPHEFPRPTIAQLLAAFPLARWVVCYGAWCDSDGRNHNLWPPACRVPAPRAVDRLKAELEVLQGTRPPLPLTASRDEIFDFDTTATPSTPKHSF